MDDSWGWDEDSFCFWPLDRVERVSERYVDNFLMDQVCYFAFADHLISLPSYSIHLSAQGRKDSLVLAIYSDNRNYETAVVADSFSEFVERYLANDISRAFLGLGMPSRGDWVTHKVSGHPLTETAHPLRGRDINR